MLRYTLTQVLAAVLVVAPLATPMAAAAAESTETPKFEQADANDDGAISIKEAIDVGVPEAEAKREDIDSDGKLTVADWQFVDMSPKAVQNSDESAQDSK